MSLKIDHEMMFKKRRDKVLEQENKIKQLEDERLKNIKKMQKFEKEYIKKIELQIGKPIEESFQEFSSEKEESSKESEDAVSDA